MCEMEIDVAVDVAGFTGDQRPGIFARRAAPVQASYLGFPGSTGADYIDYLIADAHVIPQELHHCYAEKLVLMPDSYQVNNSERPEPAPEVTRAACGLPDNGFVFCCFNASFKITPAMFDIWMRLLHAVDGSVLWLAAHRENVIHNLQKEAQARGIDPARLVFAPYKADLDAHWSRYVLADLFLDTLPFNAHATASDALWYGLPVLTCPGRSFAARVASSLLHTLGAPELVVDGLAKYERRAIELARSPNQLAELRARLIRNRTGPLFDTSRFRRHLEYAYMTMWNRYQHREPPASFTVPALTE
jgi:predicted O-linked N-acetylglucosamine transferase (SPINDLY family)